MKVHSQSPDTFRMHRASAVNEPHPKDVIVFGKYGGGGWTGHPIGLLIACGVVLLGLIGLPEARYFLAGALPIGALFGVILWKVHRWEPIALRRARR